MSERRRLTRHKCFLRGCVYFNDGRAALDCLVRDISPSGARLIFSDPVTVPDLVELYIPQKEQRLRANVQWRHNDEIGIRFAQQESTDSGLSERVERLENEIAALRDMLTRLKADVAGNSDEAA